MSKWKSWWYSLWISSLNCKKFIYTLNVIHCRYDLLSLSLIRNACYLVCAQPLEKDGSKFLNTAAKELSLGSSETGDWYWKKYCYHCFFLVFYFALAFVSWLVSIELRQPSNGSFWSSTECLYHYFWLKYLTVAAFNYPSNLNYYVFAFTSFYTHALLDLTSWIKDVS